MLFETRGVDDLDDSDAHANTALPTIVCQFNTIKAQTERKHGQKSVDEPGVESVTAPKQLSGQNEARPGIGNMDDSSRDEKRTNRSSQAKIASEGKKLKSTPEYLAPSPSVRRKMMIRLKKRVNSDYKQTSGRQSQLVKPAEAASAQASEGATQTPELPEGATAWSEGYRPKRRAAQIGSARIKNLFDSIHGGITESELPASMQEAPIPVDREELTAAQRLSPSDEATPPATVLTPPNENSTTDYASPPPSQHCSTPQESGAVNVGISCSYIGGNSRASYLKSVHEFLNSGTHIRTILDHRVSLAPVRLDICNAVWSIELYVEAEDDHSGQSGWMSEFELSWVALDLVSAYWDKFPGGRDAALNLAVPGSSLCSKRVLVILGHREVASRFELLVVYQGMGMSSLSWEWIQSLNSRFALDARTLGDYWESSGIKEPIFCSYYPTAESVVDVKSVPVWVSDLN